jgi:two-component system, response regulator YesN
MKPTMKILLVDDEVAICRGMKKLILKADAESVIVAEAYDGVEALDMMEEFNPDVLLTDMRMPRMDGLQLLREAKKRNPGLLTAVVSAYSDYEYIREAMLTHASDYLLKPATANEIQELLQKLKLKYKQLLMSREQETLGLLLQGLPLDNCPPSLQFSHYALLLVCAGPYINGVMDDRCPGEALWQSTLFTDYSACCEELDIRRWILNGERPNERLVLLAANDDDAEARIRSGLDSFRPHMLSQQIPVTLVTESGMSLHQLNAISKQLRRELVHSLVFAKSNILNRKDSRTKETDAERRFTTETAKVIEAVAQKRYERFVQELSALMSSWESRAATQYVIQQTLFRILAGFGEHGLERQIDLEMSVSRSLSYTELKTNICILFDELFESLSSMADNSAQLGTIVGQVEQFLKKNFRETITLHSLSQEFRLVPNYLSVIFKREIGTTPIEYLMEFRIKEAKRIMDERPQMLLKQVAVEVGYQDQLYFSRVFKKLTGQAPSEYVHTRQR